MKNRLRGIIFREPLQFGNTTEKHIMVDSHDGMNFDIQVTDDHGFVRVGWDSADGESMFNMIPMTNVASIWYQEVPETKSK